jgi:hypothetical protein
MKNRTYAPNPIDTSHIKVPPDLLDLADTLARNVHDTWAQERIRQGWQYGPERNDAKKLHPCLVPYDDLPDSEKIYDYNTAMETIKVILGLGYGIEKKE